MGVIATNTSGLYTSYSGAPLKAKLSASATGFSFSFWLKPNAAPSSGTYSGCVCVGDVNGQFDAIFGWDHSSSAYHACFYITINNSAWPVVADPSPPSDNAWHHYVATYTASDYKMRLYRDGNLVAGPYAQPYGALGTTYNEYVSALCNSWAAPSTYTNNNQNLGMAELAVWNTVLTSGDVTSLYAGALPTAIERANLQCFWTLYGPSGSQFDFSSNGVLGAIYSGGTIGVSDASNSFASGRPTYPTIIVVATNPVAAPNRQKVVIPVANPTIGGAAGISGGTVIDRGIN